MQLKLNGRREEIAAGATVAVLLDSLGVDPATVVVERNGEILARERYAIAALEEGDQIEIVRFVGGG